MRPILSPTNFTPLAAFVASIRTVTDTIFGRCSTSSLCPSTEARHKPVIRVVAGDLHRVVDAAEKELANRGRHYQAGGLIVSVATDPASGDPSIVPTSAPALTRELSVAATWEKYDGRAGAWVRCDPPPRHAGILYDAQQFRYLPALAGVARQPYFRELDGELVKRPAMTKPHIVSAYSMRGNSKSLSRQLTRLARHWPCWKSCSLSSISWPPTIRLLRWQPSLPPWCARRCPMRPRFMSERQYSQAARPTFAN